MKTENIYYNEQKRSDVMEAARRLRRKFSAKTIGEMDFQQENPGVREQERNRICYKCLL